MSKHRKAQKKAAGLLAEQVDVELLEKMRRIELGSDDPLVKAKARRYINALEWWISTGQSRGFTPPGEGLAADRIVQAYERRNEQ